MFNVCKSESFQTLSNDVESYIVYTVCRGILNKDFAKSGVDIGVTGNIRDTSQKNFEILIQSVGLRAMPVAMTDPIITSDLAMAGSKSFNGEGYVWKFSVDQKEVFVSEDNNVINNVGLLIEEINGIVLADGTVLSTKGKSKNIEFRKLEVNSGNQ